jgi:dTDP-4-dehydrorhamnose 3,5-epimerase
MIILETIFKGLYEIQLNRNGDNRGWFMRTFDSDFLSKNIPGFDSQWKQMNHSFNSYKYTWRGFHYQMPPFQEVKVVRCIRGAIIDCVLDLRQDSETYLKTFQIELTQQNDKMLYIPRGLAHGFLTLEDNVEILYMHDEFYNPQFEKGVRFNDPKISFNLPITPSIISERDKNHLNIK